MPKRPVVLIVLDGWGIPADETGTAVAKANPENFNALKHTYPYTTLLASGQAVGLMPGQMGDSNVGHLNMGAGHIVYQDLVRIFRAIDDGSFFSNPALVSAMEGGPERPLHLMGLISDGGVHSHEEHLYALLKMARERGKKNVFIHAFLDGRDVPPKSAGAYLDKLERKIDEIGTGKIASIMGRYWAMDRDKRWDRTEKAYRALTLGEGRTARSAEEALEIAYSQDETDEFVRPTVIVGEKGDPVARIEEGHSVIFFNFRADRARQISHAFCDESFEGFPRGKRPDVEFVAMLRYEEDLRMKYAFPPLILKNTCGEVISKAGKRQLRVAETEKYAHVTFFFSGKKEEAFPGEDRCLIPSPKVATYDLKPEMSAYEVTDEAVKRLGQGIYDFILLNYANPDMVGHTGVFDAAVKAIRAVDDCLGRLVAKVKEVGGISLVVADHGNIEELREGGAHTYHTDNPVPCILVGDEYKGRKLRQGILSDVAPTVLELIGLGLPPEMDRRSLLEV